MGQRWRRRRTYTKEIAFFNRQRGQSVEYGQRSLEMGARKRLVLQAEHWGKGSPSPVPTGGLPDIFGIHKPRPTKQDSESPSASMFTKVNGKQRETLSSSSLARLRHRPLRTEPDASVRPSILQILASLHTVLPLIAAIVSASTISVRPDAVISNQQVARHGSQLLGCASSRILVGGKANTSGCRDHAEFV